MYKGKKRCWHLFIRERHLFLPPTHSNRKQQHMASLQYVTKPLYRHCVFQRRHNDKEHHSMRVRTACLQQIKQGLDWFLSEEWIGNVFATCSIAEGSRKWPKGPVTFKRDLLTWSSISVQITLMSCFTLLMPWIDIYVYPNSEPSWQDSGITSIHSIP